MQVWSSFEDLKQARARANLSGKPLVVTVGNFDGVHQGHQVLLKRTIEVSKEKNWFSLVVTFARHTSVLLRHSSPPLLISPEERLEFFSEMGFDGCLLLTFTPELAALSPEDFLLQLVDSGAEAIIVGHDFTFGQGATGDTDYLLDFGRRHGIFTEVIPPVKVNGKAVCSTRIRLLLREGRLKEANGMLKHPFTVTGTVVHGDHRGARILGFPTANLHLPAEKLLPKYGVYLVRSYVRGREYYGLANVGVKPTFSAHRPIIEVYLFDTSEDLYGAEMTVEFLEFIRDERKFSSAAELIDQMRRDEQEGRRLLALKAVNDL